MNIVMPALTRESARTFADQFRSARLAALADAESFDQIIHVIERLGSYLTKEEFSDHGKHGDLGKYKITMVELVQSHGLAAESRAEFKNLLTPFETLYDLVKNARNDALHQGAFARHLTKHAIELAIILEDLLSNYLHPVVTDFMVRNPICGEPWQPVAFLRQQMLANSFSYLPVLQGEKEWGVVSDAAIAKFLGPKYNGGNRTKRLAMTIDAASTQNDNPISLLRPAFVEEADPLEKALDRLTTSPILLVRSPSGTSLLGILTAFDLL
jgi:CBS domain-containing protein